MATQKDNILKDQIVLYKDESGQIDLNVQLKEDTVWLSQKQMSGLFQKDTDTIGLHIRNIYKEGELLEKSTTEYFSVVQKEGKREILREVKHYNLDVIISVGYRVKSRRGTQFRIWANRVLKDYLVCSDGIPMPSAMEYHPVYYQNYYCYYREERISF